MDEGRTLETATVRLWPGEDRRSCCSPGALQMAARTASHLGLSHHVLDREREFAADVVEPFVAGYLAGETPNPCVVCNPGRLAGLVGLAEELGLARVATGHDARIVWRDGEPFVARGADPVKDQSYMLWAVPPDVLARLEFPLGDMTKSETRAAAERAQLPSAAEPESQEVCFAVEGYQRFLEERDVAARQGPIVTRDGAVIGTHEGQWRFTVGQRRGLNVSASQPLFVLERRATGNVVVAGAREELLRDEVLLRGVVDRGLDDPAGLEVQLRYRSPAVRVAGLELHSHKRATVRLDKPFAGVAAGQSAVFYRGDVVVGGGLVTASGPASGECDTLRGS